MPHLRLTMLGPFQALLDGQPLRSFASDKERALLAYLALGARARPVRRETLVRLFWDGFTEETARHSLRNALYNLRKLLAPLDLLHTTRQTVHLETAHPGFWCDAVALEAVAADHTASLPQMEEALALARSELLVDLLQAAPNLCLLVTSRRRLDLQAEYAFRLAGLPVPPQAAPGQPGLSLDALQGYSSVQLFAERADRRRGGFELDGDSQEAVARICRLVEGMPLGIELAAALTDQYSCAEIASAIAATVDILAGGMADLAPQHRSLRAVFEYSWRLLAQPEQAVLARCAVFRGGFTVEAGAAVAGASPEVLAGLADKSLLRQVDEARYDMHDLLRQLAAEKLLEEPGAREATAAQHCAYLPASCTPEPTTCLRIRR